MADEDNSYKPLTPPRCGAMTRKGVPCKQSGMKNGRCRNHGGLSTGAPKGNTNGIRHGFYYNALLPDEQDEFLEALGEGSSAAALEAELALMRVKLKRLLKLCPEEWSTHVEQQVDLILKSGLAPNSDDLGGYDKRELKASIPRVGSLIVEAIESIRKLSLSISQLKKDEKELAADHVDDDTEINVNVTVVTAAD